MSGRVAELAALDAVLAAAECRPSVMVMSGDAGIGKTHLLQWAVEQARARSFRVLLARPGEHEQSLSFSGLSDLFAGVSDDVINGLPPLQSQPLLAALLRTTTGVQRHDRRAVSSATLSLLELFSRATPVLVAVDDLQNLDPPTSRVLEFVLHRLERIRLGVLLTVRGGTNDVSTVLGSVPSELVTHISVRELPRKILEDIVHARVGNGVPTRAIHQILDAAGGNPLFAIELAGALRSGSDAESGMVIPRSLQTLVEDRFRRLSRDARRVLAAAAAVKGASPEVLGIACDLGPEEVHILLESAEDSELVILGDHAKPVQFTHPLYASAAYGSISPSERRRLHRLVAPAIDDQEECARHLALGAWRPDSTLAAELERASGSALRRGAPETAHMLAHQALRLTPMSERSDAERRTVNLAEHLLHAGDLILARATLDKLLATCSDSGRRADALRVLGEVVFLLLGFSAAEPLFTEALELRPADVGFTSRVQLRMAYGSMTCGDIPGAYNHSRIALSSVGSVPEPGHRAEVLGVACMAQFMMGGGLDENVLSEALLHEDPSSHAVIALRPTLVAGCLRLFQGRLKDAVTLLGPLRTDLRARGLESDLSVVCSYLAWAHCWLGALDAAEATVVEGITAATRQGASADACELFAFGAVVSAFRGRSAEVMSRSAHALSMRMDGSLGLTERLVSWANGISALARGDSEGALTSMRPLLELAERYGLAEPVAVMCVADVIEALILTGHIDRANDLLETLEESAFRLQRPWAIVGWWRCRALLCESRGDLELAAKFIALALEWCPTLELQIEVARTLQISGQIHRRLKSKEKARAELKDALDRFERCGAAPWAERTRLELARIPSARSPRATTSGSDLSATQERVALLAGSGLRNREIALRLQVSPKTVEANLAAVYAKLGINSRAQLGAWMAARQPDGT